MSGDVSAFRDAELELEKALCALDSAEGALAERSAPSARMERACIELFMERMLVNRGDALRPDYEEIDAPVIALSFRYPGCEIPCNEPQFGRGFTRDVEAETRARHTLESFG